MTEPKNSDQYQAGEEKIRIKDESNDKKYFIITPRIVKAFARNPFDFALWDTIKDIAGEDGECYLNTEQLAILSGMSTGQVSKSRQYWIKIGFLKGQVRKDEGFSQAVWHLTIPDIWQKNITWCEKHPKIADRIQFKLAHRSLHPVKAIKKPSPHEGKPSPGETKNNNQEKPLEVKGGERKKITGAGIDWALGHNQPIEDMDEDAKFRFMAMNAAGLIATGKPILYEYALSYMLASRTIPTEKQIKHWRKTFIEWLDIQPDHPSPADVTTGVVQHIGKDLSFSGPHSFTYIFTNPKGNGNNGHNPKGNHKGTDSQQVRNSGDSYTAEDYAAADRINRRANGS